MVHCIKKKFIVQTCLYNRCSRGHPEPEASNTLLFASMYNHFELEQGLKDDLDTTGNLNSENIFVVCVIIRHISLI